MSKKPTNKRGAQSGSDLPGELPDLPDLPDLGGIDDLELPDLGALDDGEGMSSPFAEADYTGNFEQDGATDDKVIDTEFAALREGRKQQQQAVELANDSEYWFAMYFQTREQKERFLAAMKWIAHGDKYLDGQWVAKKQGIELPPRPAPYKVGRLDRKLTDLT